MTDPEPGAQEQADWTNIIELRVLGLMRSGNHAIIEWILNQHSGHPVCFLNNVRHGDHDPYLNYKQIIVKRIDYKSDIERLRSARKKLLVYSYEDRAEAVTSETDLLASVFQPDFNTNRERYLMPSRSRFDVFIIRDPFNCMASRLKMMHDESRIQKGVSDPDLILHNWKILAREAIALTKDPVPGKIVVSYNRWISDAAFREELSSHLMGAYDDSTMEQASRFGGRSSFDAALPRLSFSDMAAQWWKLLDPRRYARIRRYWERFRIPKASRMKVLARWRLMSEDAAFRRLMKDDEVFALSEELFGEIPGTRELLK